MADINVFGSALGQVTPDIAEVSVSVGARNYPSPGDARAAFAVVMPRVRELLAGADKYYERRASSHSWHDDTTKSDRYRVTADVTARYPVGSDGLAAVIDALSDMPDVTFRTTWDVTPALFKSTRDALLAEAVVDARRQAAAIAGAAGQTLVSLKLVAEPELFPNVAARPVGGDIAPVTYRMAAMSRGGAVPEREVDVQLTPEPIDIAVKIAVSYYAE